MAAVVAGGLLMFLGLRLLRHGTAQLKADVVGNLAYDGRAPVLYLRSFRADELGSEHQLIVAEVPFRIYTEEEQLARAFGRIGPMLAVGDPTDPAPPLGSERVYLPDQEWMPIVRELMRAARLVVILVGPGPSVRWEIREALASVPHNRIVLLIPSVEAGQEVVAECFPAQARPESAGAAAGAGHGRGSTGASC